jgi:hypothetical protein
MHKLIKFPDLNYFVKSYDIVTSLAWMWEIRTRGGACMEGGTKSETEKGKEG